MELIGMAWKAPIVGYVNALGYLHCAECSSEGSPVYGDLHFGPEDKCDRCGAQLLHVLTSEYQQS